MNHPFGSLERQAEIAALAYQQRAMTLTDMGLGGYMRGSPFVSNFNLDAKAREYVEGSFPRLHAIRGASRRMSF